MQPWKRQGPHFPRALGQGEMPRWRARWDLTAVWRVHARSHEQGQEWLTWFGGMGAHGRETRAGIRDTKTRLAGGWWEFAGGKCTSAGWKRIEKAVDEAKIKWLEHGGFLANGGWMSCSDSLLQWWGGDKVPTGLGQDQRWGCGKQETLPCL